MSILYINTGTSPNSGDGDSIRTAFNKVNYNFGYILENITTGTSSGTVTNPTLTIDDVQDVVNNSVAHDYHRGIRGYFDGTRIILSLTGNFVSLKVLNTLTVAGSLVDINGNDLIPDQLLNTSSSVLFDSVSVYNTSTLNDLYVNTITVGPGGLISNGINVLPDQMLSTASSALFDSITVSNTASVRNTIFQGRYFDGLLDPGTTIRVDSSASSYTQMVVKNYDTGTTATSDIIILNNAGTVQFGNYIDIGINNTNYVEEPFGIHTPGSGYLFTDGSDLIIGTKTPYTKLKFHAGGTSVYDSAAELDGYTWKFNRSVQTIVSTAGPLNFTVWNTANNSAAQSVYQAMNNYGESVQLGINSTHPEAVFGNIGPGESFLHNSLTTSTMHIGDGGDLVFYSNQQGYYGTATLRMSRIDRSSTFSGDVLPLDTASYSLGSTAAQWGGLYVSTSTVYIGGNEVSILNGQLSINGMPALTKVDTIPLSSTSSGATNQVAFTGTDLYICVAPDSWVKFSGTTF